MRRILIQFCVRTVIWIRKLLLAGAITLPLARPRRPIVGLGRRSLSFTPALLEAWFNWEGGQVRLDASPRLLTPVRPSSSSSPHLSLFSAASRCFTGATTLLSAVPVVLFTSGCGSVCLFTLVLLGASFCNLVTTTSCRAGLTAMSSTRRTAASPFCLWFVGLQFRLQLRPAYVAPRHPVLPSAINPLALIGGLLYYCPACGT